jgi:hypothetical protein
VKCSKTGDAAFRKSFPIVNERDAILLIAARQRSSLPMSSKAMDMGARGGQSQEERIQKQPQILRRRCAPLMMTTEVFISISDKQAKGLFPQC